MKFILQYTIRNILQNKIRTLIVILTICVSTGLFFVSLAIQGTIKKAYTEQMRTSIGEADVSITPQNGSPSRFMNKYVVEPYKEMFEYSVGTNKVAADYNNGSNLVGLNLNGFNLDELQKMFTFQLEEQISIQPFEGRKIIISKNASERYNLNLGDSISIQIGNNKYFFCICGIAKSTGIFQENGGGLEMVVPMDTIGTLVNALGKVTTIYIKLKDTDQESEAFNNLSRVLSRYNLQKTISLEEINTFAKKKSNSFMQIVIIAVFLSMFIIFTSFKFISRERIPYIGIFRCIGATKGIGNLILFLESILYGVIGGLTGCFLGVIMLSVISRNIELPFSLSTGKWIVDFNFIQLLYAFVIAISISFIGSYISIIKVTNIPLKEIVLNNIKKVGKKEWSKVTGVVLLVSSLVLAFTLHNNQVACIIAMILILASTVLLTPVILQKSLKMLEIINLFIFGNEGILAVKNLKGNQNILTNISLLAIGISAFFMINTASEAVLSTISNLYKDYNFEILIYGDRMERNMLSSLSAVNGVNTVLGVYEVSNVNTADSNKRINLIRGIDTDNFFDFMNIDILGDRDVLLKRLNTERTIIITNTLRDTLRVNINDVITLNMISGMREYRVIGFFDSIEKYGSYALVSDIFLKSDMRLNYYNTAFIKTMGDTGNCETDIRRNYAQQHMQTCTVEQLTLNDLKVNKSTLSIMKGFVLISLLIGSIGLINNFVISYIERLRSFAILRSIGMDIVQNIKVIIIESLTVGMLGSIMGLLTGMLLSGIVPNILKANGFLVTVKFSPVFILVCFIVGILITILSSLIPAKMSTKLSIINAIKYE
jgi:putative ABC transport system permease protein